MSERVNMLDTRHLTRKLIVFALPVLACGVVQQSFNAIDIAVVGQCASPGALAAVGANTPVIGLMINLFMGISLGTNVVIANYLGQKNASGVRKAVSTSVALALICGVLMTITGTCLAGPMLELLDTPAEVLGRSSSYLRIYATGFPAMMIFNFASAILRSIGDTRRPFYCLVIGGIINVLLNLYFVLGLKMDVEGVAIATSISNYISAVCVVYLLLKEKGDIKLNIKEIRVYTYELGKILRIGLPAGIQGMVFSLSNVFIQSGINSLGPLVMGGSAAALNYEFYGYFIISCFVQAALAFMSQNYGAGNYSACRLIYRRCMMLSLVGSLTFSILVACAPGTFAALFSNHPEEIAHAVTRLRWVFLWQFIACSYEISGGALRALGHSVLPMIVTIVGTCILRIIWMKLHLWHSFNELLLVYPISWTVTGTFMVGCWIYIYHAAC